MSTTLQPPPPPGTGTRAAPTGQPDARRARAPVPRGWPEDVAGARAHLLLAATAGLLVAACLPLTRIYVGLAFLRPVLGAVVLAVGLSWGARRLAAGPVASLLASALGWVAFCSAAFFPDTLAYLLLPTRETVSAGVDLWTRGLELMAVRQPPTFAEAGLMFITVTGVWAVAHAVEGLVFRLGAPLKAIVMALALWTVPLTLAPAPGRVWPVAVPLLAAAALLLLGFAGLDLRGWGRTAVEPAQGRSGATHLLPAGATIAAVAIVAGALVAGLLPGYGQPPWYELRGLGGTTLTTNPIVDIRTRLVASDRGPVLRVTTDRPVYLRTTSLDRYSDGEEWTNSGIRGAPIDGDVPFEVPLDAVEQVNVDVEVVDLPQAVLVPAPYQAARVSGPAADAFQYDQRNSTLTLDQGRTLSGGDRYSVVAAIPAPAAEQLDGVRSFAPTSSLTELPDNVPAEVGELAREIVAREGAETPFRQALAIQDELRSWSYSTDPPQGHSGQAMAAFLETRTGYCEQFAGTMAVMLRGLDIPARVAVGYTPGRPARSAAGSGAGVTVGDEDAPPGPEQYVITNANAHAWVEVLFPGIGWVAFEPTPRSDGNVLVPTAANLAPSMTVESAPARFDPIQPLPDERSLALPDVNTEQPPAPAPAPEASRGIAGGSTAGRGTAATVLLLAVGAVLAVGLLGARRRARPERPPAERVLRAFGDVERVGRGMGLGPAVSETDTEYLRRVAARGGDGALATATTLGTGVAQARWSARLDRPVADRSEAAASTLTAQLLEPLPGARRTMVRTRGALAMGLTRLRAAARASTRSAG